MIAPQNMESDEESPGKLIAFPFVPGQEFDVSARYDFWNNPTTVEWFKTRGYILYELLGGGESIPTLPSGHIYEEAIYPWPYYDTIEGPLKARDFTVRKKAPRSRYHNLYAFFIGRKVVHAQDLMYNSFHSRLRAQQRLSYVLFDFDHSTMFHPDADKRELRLPYQKAWGSFNYTGDTDAGEYDFDPFALDVGTMGWTLRGQFNCFIPLFPGLAPLFDMMMNWDVRRRLTASQALEFFEARVSELPEDPSEIRITTKAQLYSGGLDVWEGLPPDFVEKWKMYRALPKPWSRRVLSCIAHREWMCHVIPWVRWQCHRLF